MLQGAELIDDAEWTLRHGVGSVKERLFEAGKAFWAAIRGRDSWPEQPARAADELIDVLFARGSMRDTIDAMDESTAQRTAADILNFCGLFHGLAARSDRSGAQTQASSAPVWSVGVTGARELTSDTTPPLRYM